MFKAKIRARKLFETFLTAAKSQAQAELIYGQPLAEILDESTTSSQGRTQGLTEKELIYLSQHTDDQVFKAVRQYFVK